jgi:hypothetical protein
MTIKKRSLHVEQAPFDLVPDARYGSHRRQDRRRNRRDNLHNTLKRYRYLFVFIWLYPLFYEILSLFQNNLLSLQNKNNEAMDEKTKEEQWMN